MTKALKERVIGNLMSVERGPSEQRYFKLAQIAKSFDDPLRAIDLLLNMKEGISEIVSNLMTEDSISSLIAQQTCQTLQEKKVSRNNAERSLFYELC